MAILNEELIKNIMIEVEDGLPLNYACDLFGISAPNLTNWMKQGQSDFENERETIHAQFFKSYKKSYAKFIRDCKKRIKSGESGWQGTAWWLERTNKQFIINNDNTDTVEPVIVKATMTKKEH